MVLTTGNITISFFILSKVDASIVILDGIGIFISRRMIFIFGFLVGRSWGIGWGRGMVSQSYGSQGKDDQNLIFGGK